MTHPPNPTQANPDARIDQVLNALRTTQAPTGLEQRVAQRATARLAHPSEARTTAHPPFASTASHAAPSFFAVILNAVKDPRIFFAEARPYTLPIASLILLLSIVSITFLTHQPPHTTAQSKPTPNQTYAPTQPATPATAASVANTHAPQASVPANNPVPQGFSLASPSPPNNPAASTPPPTDPDTIALAETQAPSHPAPPMPLTQQELLLLAATRPGQPIEIAELEPFREPALRSAAEAHERAGLERFVHSLLAPLAVSESLNPTPQDDSPPAPTSSNPNEQPTNGDTPHAP